MSVGYWTALLRLVLVLIGLVSRIRSVVDEILVPLRYLVVIDLRAFLFRRGTPDAFPIRVPHTKEPFKPLPVIACPIFL